MYKIYITFFFIEIDYWNKRHSNLKNINQQLQTVNAYKIIKILKLSNSAYYPGFRCVYENVQKGIFFLCVNIRENVNVNLSKNYVH